MRRLLDVAGVHRPGDFQRSKWGGQRIGAESAARHHRDTPGQRPGVTLSQQRSTIISFWGSWCAPCKQDAPYLNRLATHHHVIGVEYGGETGAAVEAVKEFGLSFPQYYVDPANMATYHLPGVPVTVFVDHTGTVRHLQIGRFTSDAQAEQLATQYAS